MLRIRFDLADLTRVRLAPGGVAMAIEALFSSLALRQRDAAPLFGGWSARLRPRIPAAARPLFEVFDPYGGVPTSLIKRTDSSEVFAEHVMSLPADRWRAELAAVGYGAVGGYRRRFASGEPAARREFAAAVTAYRGAFDAEHRGMRELIDADLGYRASLLARHGLSALFGSLHPAARWDPPILHLAGYAGAPGPELKVEGRELVLTPSVFLWRGPRVLAEPERIYLSYPARGTLGLARAEPDPLAELLGGTRAAVLRALAYGRTTSELAAACEISVASASEHAAVLRRAHLVVTHREGRSVRHQLTPLGRRALYADPPDPDPR